MARVSYLLPIVLTANIVLMDYRANGQDSPLSTYDNSSTPPTTQSNSVEQPKPSTELPAVLLVLKLKERKVHVYRGEQKLASYPVAVGKKGWETPTGKFKVIQMIENPVWQNPWNGRIVPAGPKNPLGERWIGFWTDGKNYIGFHGTAAENLIGQAVSHGCVRMRNKDIKAMFEKIEVGTSVVVEP